MKFRIIHYYLSIFYPSSFLHCFTLAIRMTAHYVPYWVTDLLLRLLFVLFYYSRKENAFTIVLVSPLIIIAIKKKDIKYKEIFDKKLAEKIKYRDSIQKRYRISVSEICRLCPFNCFEPPFFNFITFLLT